MAYRIGDTVRNKLTGDMGQITAENGHACKVFGFWHHTNEIKTIIQEQPLARNFTSPGAMDHLALATLVVTALRGLLEGEDPQSQPQREGRSIFIHEAWARVVDPATEVVVTDLSGDEDGVCGGECEGKTFKVSLVARNDIPRGPKKKLVAYNAQLAVALHRSEEHRDSFFSRRMRGAAEQFSKYELGAQRLVEGSHWWIETWEGGRCGPWRTKQDYEIVGRLLAQVHRSIPIDWFDKYRTEIVTKWPLAKTAPWGSHVWICLSWGLWESEWFSVPSVELEDTHDMALARAIAAFNDDPDFFAEWADMGALKPEHSVAKRLVTVHGDYHPGNVLERKRELKGEKVQDDGNATEHLCVDFEMTCVSSAIYDLAFVVNSEIPSFVQSGPEQQAAIARTFVAAYLDGVGQPHSSEAELDLLVTDCMLGGFFLREVGLLFWDSLMQVRQGDDSSVERTDAREYLQKCKAWAAEVRAGGPAMWAEVARGRGLTWEGKVWPCRRIE